MPALRLSGLVVALVLAQAGLARAEGPTIEHSAIKCLVEGKYRKMPARFAPPEVAQPRVYFRPEGVPSWYYVEMKPETPLGHVGVLPKPTKKLVGKHIEYYLEAASKDFDTGRTPEYDPIVVAKDSDCSNDPVVALYSNEPPSAVFPSLPEGFALGGGAAGGTALAVIGGGVAVGTAAVLIAKGGDEDEGVPPPVTQPPVTSPPITSPPITQPPVTPGMDVACQADPRQGAAPLQVKFSAQATGGNGVFNYAWNFGDGDTSTQVNPSHTYTTPGTYVARVVVTSGDRAALCARPILVLGRSFRLQANVAGGGTGTVSGDGISCPGDCSEELAPGTSATLSASATGGSTFAGWSGDCSGTGTCTVVMDGDRSVTATFNPPPTLFPLNVTLLGSGSGTVSGSGIACPGTCSQSYTAGTPVSLTAAPGASTFGGWGGACAGTTGLTCNLLMTGPLNVTATFNAPVTFRLTLTVTGQFGGAGRVDVNPSVFATCSSGPPPGTVCTAVYSPGEPIVLTAVTATGFFSGYSGACAGTKGNICNLIMSQDRNVGALFDGGTQPPAGTASLTSAFEVAGARGQVMLNGVVLSAPDAGTTSWTVTPAVGENRLEARILAAGKPGIWRFDLSGIPGLERGSLRVLSGEVVAVGPDSVVFRSTGRAGEHVGLAFTSH